MTFTCLILTAMLLNSCRPDANRLQVVKATIEQQGRRASVARRYVALKVDTIADLQARGIATPQKVFATSGGFVLQSGTTGVIGLTRAGSVRWRHDVSKDGVTRITDMQTGTRDEIIIVDDPAKLGIVLGPDGSLLATFPLTHVGHVDGFVSLSANRMVAVTGDSVNALVEFDKTGHVLSRRAFPWPSFQRMHPLARQGYFASAYPDTAWAFAFAFGDRFFGFDGLNRRPYIGTMLEEIQMPDVIVSSKGFDSSEKLGRATLATQSIVIRGGVLSILFVGADTALAGKVIDRFSLKTGSYLQSYVLPARARHIASDDAETFVLTAKVLLGITAREK